MKTIKCILLGIVLASTNMYAQNWLLLGNAGTNDPAVPATYGTSTIGGSENWVGTTDAQDLVIGTNNIERFRVKQSGSTAGFVGIGTASPQRILHITTTQINGGIRITQTNASGGASTLDLQNTTTSGHNY